MGMSDKDKYRHLRAASHITQFGLDMVTPVVLCTIIAVWIKNTFNAGSLTVIVGIIVGVACMVLNLLKYINKINGEMEGKRHDEKRED